MSTLETGGYEIKSIFQLIGDKENDITKSIAWALNKCPVFMKAIISDVVGVDVNPESVTITYQKYESDKGITDLEITDGKEFYAIIEAKRGWILPESDQLTMYSERTDLKKSPAKKKIIVSMSECSLHYADINLPFKSINGIPIKHLPWQRIFELAEEARTDSNHAQKHLLDELKEYLGGLMTMQAKDSNWVYVVALSDGKPDKCDLTWIDFVEKYKRYFHPVGGNGWPKNPPNYIGFRYHGKLQSIHHIEDYVVTNNMHDEFSEMPDKVWEKDHFIYKLGPAIVPSKTVKTGKIYPSGRVWAMLDTLLTADTISEARDISKER